MTDYQFIIVLCLFFALALVNLLLWARARKKANSDSAECKAKTRYMKKIVLLCLSMLSILTLSCIALAWAAEEQLDSDTAMALCGAWGVEVGVLGKIKWDETKQEAVEKAAEKYTQPQQPEP